MTKFKRQHQDRFKRVKDTWRKPKGRQSKQRLTRKGSPAVPTAGRGTKAEERGLHPSGYREVLVHTPSELDDVEPEEFAVRIGSTVGGRKRETIEEKCEELGITVLNPSGGEE